MPKLKDPNVWFQNALKVTEDPAASGWLKNLIEQDHRAIKRRCASMAGLKSLANAAITIAGIELAHRIRKGQFSFGRGRRRRGWSRKAEWAMALA